MRTIEVSVVGVDNLLFKEGIYAECDYCEPAAANPREFLIRIDNSMSNHIFLKTLMHEMVHVKQFAKGEFKQLTRFGKDVYRWQKTQVDTSKMEYWDFPWEIEAHGREIGLLHQFCNKSKEYIELTYIEM